MTEDELHAAIRSGTLKPARIITGRGTAISMVYQRGQLRLQRLATPPDRAPRKARYAYTVVDTHGNTYEITPTRGIHRD